MGVVLKKISSATSGLNEAFTSLLRGFEVCSENYTIFSPEALDARPRWQTGDHIVMIVLYICTGI